MLIPFCLALAQTPGNGPETAAAVQEPENKPAVAVYVAGDVQTAVKDFFGEYLLTSLVNGGAAANDDTAAAFLAAIAKEQSKRKKALNDSLVCLLSRKFNIRYVCMASITLAPDSVFTLSARIISAKTGKSRFNGETAGPLKTMEDLEQACGMVVEKMFGGRRIFDGQAASEVAVQTADIVTNIAADSVARATTDSVARATADSVAKAAADSVARAAADSVARAAADSVARAAADSVARAAADSVAKVAVDSVTDASVVAVDTDTAEDTAFVFKSPSMRVKNVAVVETEIDAQSGASAELTAADARLVTAELRREAVKNLPRGKYNVMTSETVYAQGSAVLEKCADENCVITLGSAIGADYIVRGTISKIQTRFTLSVEVYETEDGNLVASSEPIRSESLGDLLEQAAEVCAEMYKTFAIAHAPPPEPVAPPPTPVIIQEPDTPLWKLHKIGIDISVGAGGVIMGGYGGGIEWSGGERVTMPYSASGVYAFLDAVYIELFLGYYAGTGKWESQSVPDPKDLPDMPRSYINIGFFAKYPFECYGHVKLFPLLGLDYDASIFGKIEYSNGNGEYVFNGANNRPGANTLSSLWFKFGGGIDVAMGKIVYLRSELIYGLRAANTFEWYCVDNLPYDVSAKFGQGIVFKAGVGIKL